MTRRKSTGRLGPKAGSELQEISMEASKDETVRRVVAAFRELSSEKLAVVVHELGMDCEPEVMRNLECIRKGLAVDAFEHANAQNREPTIEELESAVREVGIENAPEVVRKLQRIRDNDKVIKASELMIEAYALLRDLQKRGGDMEIEAIRGFLEMADLAVDGLSECSELATVSVAETKTSWPVMMEGHGPKALEALEVELKRIKLGRRNSSSVRINSVITAASRHKFVVTSLYSTVRAIFNLDRFSSSVTEQPIRIARLREDMRRNYKMLMRLVDGYEANDWREEDLKELGKKLKALHGCPEVNKASFNEWFGACVALLDCITRSQFYLPRFKLRNLGEARAQKRVGMDSDYRDGITGALKSALKTVLKINRKKDG